MIREHTACIFASSPIADCGRDMRLPEPVLASHWPLSVIGLAIFIFAVWTFARAIYHRPIDWQQTEEPSWDTGDEERPTIEIRARRAGE